MKKNLTFLVQGSAANPYEVTIINRGNGNLSAYCTCPAGEKGTHCKHRINILSGKTVGIISENGHEVDIVKEWIKGSDIEAAIHAVEQSEYEVDLSKSKLARAKKALAMAMLD